jgi:tRNA A58 N-methylase Trm61
LMVIESGSGSGKMAVAVAGWQWQCVSGKVAVDGWQQSQKTAVDEFGGVSEHSIL